MTPNRKPELTKEETEGFNNFGIRHYADAWEMAGKVLEFYGAESGFNKDGSARLYMQSLIDDSDEDNQRVRIAIFDKIASPRIYLIDAWRKLSSEEHMVYSYPDPVEREKAKAEAERISKQVGEMIQG